MGAGQHFIMAPLGREAMLMPQNPLGPRLVQVYYDMAIMERCGECEQCELIFLLWSELLRKAPSFYGEIGN
jgi:hypothetical protein